MNRNTKRIAAVGLPLATVAAAGIAFAAWTTDGSGVGSAQSRAAQNVTFAAGTVANTLYPTGSGDLALSVTNPNAYKVSLNTFVLNAVYDAATYVDSTNTGTNIKGTCDLTISQPLTAPTVNGGATSPVTLTINMGNASSNTVALCAGKTFVADVSSKADSAS